MGGPNVFEKYDFGAKLFFQWLADVGPTKIATVAWATSFAAIVVVTCSGIAEVGEDSGPRTLLTDSKAALRRLISSHARSGDPTPPLQQSEQQRKS